jgi:hypothetical protein
VLFKQQRVQWLEVQGFWLGVVVQDRLQAEREALPPERQVGHMVFRRPAVWRATLHPFSLRHLLEKAILAALGLAQEIKEQRLQGVVGHQTFFLTSWWYHRLKDGTDAALHERREQ